MNIKRIKYTWHEFFPEGTCLAFLYFRFPALKLIFLAYFNTIHLSMQVVATMEQFFRSGFQ